MNQRFTVLVIPFVLFSVVFFSGVTYFLLIPYVPQSIERSEVLSQLMQAPSVPSWRAGVVEKRIAASDHAPELVFVGDIMMARSVELWMQGEGMSYPFLHTAELFASSSAVFANFEAAIPREHTRTPAYSTKFSASSAYISALASSGVTHVSLANNHSNDYGAAGYENTLAVLTKNSITPFGHSSDLSTSSVTLITSGSTTIAVLAIHTLFGQPNPVVLSRLVSYMQSISDVQIAYIHWGTEYQLRHDKSQALLANYLATLGIDAIIGHHPHVVEDIQVVNGIPVFYSLGNFIFDQYFSDDVQTGLVLTIVITDTELEFRLLPVTSKGTHAQPRKMNDTDRTDFLEKLASRSAPVLSEYIKQGKLIFSIPLAEQVKNGII